MRPTRLIAILLVTVLVLASWITSAQADGCRSAIKDNEVRLFKEQAYTGPCRNYFLEPNMRHLLVSDVKLKSKGGQSIMVGSKVKAALFNEENLLSKKHDELWIVEKNKSWSTVGRSDNWNVKSLIVFPRNQSTPHGVLIARERYEQLHNKRRKAIKFFPLPQFKNHSTISAPYLDQNIRNHARHIWIYGPKTECRLYSRKNYQGHSITLPGTTAKQSSYSLKQFRDIYKDVDSLKVWEKK